MKNNKRALIIAGCLVGVFLVSTSIYVWKGSKPISTTSLSDEALLALIKNDLAAFKSIVERKVNLHEVLPEIDGKTYTIAEGLSYFERAEFMKFLHEEKHSFVKQVEGKPFDVISLSIAKNNPDLLGHIAVENPNWKHRYGEKGWTLLHMASSYCAHKVASILHEKGELRWDTKAKDGSTPLTLAAESECLPMLGFWKEQKADFNMKDGRGLSAMSILKKKKDAALVAFVESFFERKPASVPELPDFYRKRKIPKDQIVDHAAMLEPEDRPLEATETAEISEFAD